MLNRSGVTKTTYGAPVQILANVELQASVGCIVDKGLGTAVGSKKIAKAGTPIYVDFSNLQTKVVAGSKDKPANAVLLHDVDVTSADANGTALYIGVVNINRLESDVQSKVTAGVNTIGGVSFIKA